MEVLWRMMGKKKIRYDGGLRKSMLASEGMGVEEFKRMVRETIGDGVQVGRLCYSLKYNRNMIMAVDGNMDVRMIFIENDEHGYLYVGGKDTLRHHLSNSRGNYRENGGW